MQARRRQAGAVLMLVLAPAWVGAWAQPAPGGAQQLPPVTVSLTRSEVAAFELPASVSRVGNEALREGHALVNFSESLGAVPGLLARDRQNQAQDVQLSVRGFGARASFGIRGVRLYVDGIPATLPDGQGQISHVDLGTAERIEVLRGPFSALYGNSAGGVIQVFSAEGRGAPRLTLGAASGSDGLLRLSTQLQGAAGSLAYVLGLSHIRSEGYREHSASERHLGNAKLSWRPDADSRLSLVANRLSLPQAQDPLGLTRAQFEARPRGVDSVALDYDTRKTVTQTQLGLVYERRLSAAHALHLLAYGGQRGTVQFQSIPRATQASALHPGGVIDLARDYRGLDLRWTFRTEWLEGPVSLITGLAHDELDEQRRGYQNFLGSSLGVPGALRRDERNVVRSLDPYLQLSWQFAPAWAINAGLRHSRLSFRSVDRYIVGSNPDDSGRARYGAKLPVLGLRYALSPDVSLYATAGRGYETPTLNELAYRPGGGTGMNLALQAARSHSLELGLKARRAGWGELNAAVFQTRTEQEIVTQSNSGGRASFQNAGATRRSGLELGWSAGLGEHLRGQLAATLLNARYAEAFRTCVATPCSTPTLLIPAGQRIPGIARGALFAALSWAPPRGWRAGLEARYLSAVMVNDQNSDAAAGHAVAAAHAGYVLQAGAWELTGLLRADNLFDRRYAGSVIVNEGNGRFFEPAPGRSWLASVSASLRF